jgi:hypothetical protein
MLKMIHVIEDCMGTYEVPADSIFALAPKRRGYWWDMRTKLGRQAAEAFRENERRRISEYGGEDA